MTNPFKGAQPQTDRIVAPSDPEERVRFWIERGNSMLAAEGRYHLTWMHSNGHYFIATREDAAREQINVRVPRLAA